MKPQVITTTAQQTQDFAQQFSATLIGGETILLNGDLGAGKTHFVKGVAKGLGIDDVITSPTFALHNQYNGGRLVLNHFDFYRIMDPEEAEMLGLNEFLAKRTPFPVSSGAKTLPSCCHAIALLLLSKNLTKTPVK